jgi:hypothetical protein
LAVVALEALAQIKEVMVLILFLALLLLLAVAGAVETTLATAKMAVQVVALDAPVRETQMQQGAQVIRQLNPRPKVTMVVLQMGRLETVALVVAVVRVPLV